MKKIILEIAIIDNKIAIMENGINLPQDSIESHLTIIGLLDSIKQTHLDKIKLLANISKKGRSEEI